MSNRVDKSRVVWMGFGEHLELAVWKSEVDFDTLYYNPLSGFPTIAVAHTLTYRPWKFTGRIRYHEKKVEFECVYKVYEPIGEREGWWDRFINGHKIYGFVEHTMWVDSDMFAERSKTKYSMYECGCSCEEVVYE